MTIPGLKGKAQTVLGPIDADDLGVTLPHEHLVVDTSLYLPESLRSRRGGIAYQPVSLENLHDVRYYYVPSLSNLQLGEEDAPSEALRYKNAGGRTIVDVTSVGIGRDPAALRRIAEATGLNVIMGSGYYIGPSHPPELAGKAEQASLTTSRGISWWASVTAEYGPG